MLASIFVTAGYETLRNPERVAPLAEPVVRPVIDQVPFLPEQTASAVRLNGAVQVVAGTLLAFGKVPRLSALALAATLVPTTWAGHRFWEAEDEQERAGQKIHFMKNVSMLGGLLICAADTGGRPSLAWRGQHAVHGAAKGGGKAGRLAKAGSHTAKAGGHTTKCGAKGGAKAGARLARATGRHWLRTAKWSGKAGYKAGRISERLPIG